MSTCLWDAGWHDTGVEESYSSAFVYMYRRVSTSSVASGGHGSMVSWYALFLFSFLLVYVRGLMEGMTLDLVEGTSVINALNWLWLDRVKEKSMRDWLRNLQESRSVSRFSLFFFKCLPFFKITFDFLCVRMYSCLRWFNCLSGSALPIAKTP